MVARLLCTAVAALLAAGAFLGASPTPAGPLNLLGILFLTISGVIWLGWPVIREGFAYGASPDGAQLPLLARFGPMFIGGLVGMRRPPDPSRRRSDVPDGTSAD